MPAAAILGAVAQPAVAAQSCTTSKIAVTHLVPVRHDGHVVKRHGKVVRHRVDVRVKKRERVHVRVRLNGKVHVETKWVVREVVKYSSVSTCTPNQTITAPTTTTAPAATPVAPPATATAPIKVSATIDPSWVLAVTTPQAPSVPVTFSYSATDAGQVGTLPAGTLTLNIYVHGSVAQSGGCAANVGAPVTSASCTVDIPAWGKYDLIVNYSGGTGVIATEGTETVDIEPPALSAVTNADIWGTTSPSNGASLAATVSSDSTTDAVTLTDPNFEGATSVTLTDNSGDECAATVSGTSASCTMTNTATPTSFTIAYPGGTTTTATESASPWGIAQSQTVTTTWAAQSVAITNPSVTAPTTTNVSETISQIDAYPNFLDGTAPAPCGGTNNDYCMLTGVEGLPAHGTATLTTTIPTKGIISGVTGTTTLTCTVDLTTTSYCWSALPNGIEPNGTANPWTVTASWTGYSTGSYNVVNYSAPTVTYTMTSNSSWNGQTPASWYPGTAPSNWFRYDGNS